MTQLERNEQGLTPAMRLGAYLESQGATRKEIASGVGVTDTTVSRWRAEQAYKDEVERWQKVEIQRFEALAGRFRYRLFEVGMEALESVSERMRSGDPGAALLASEQIFDLLEKLNLFRANVEKEGVDSSAKAAAALTVTINTKDDTIRQKPDVDVEGVEDDEDR